MVINHPLSASSIFYNPTANNLLDCCN